MILFKLLCVDYIEQSKLSFLTLTLEGFRVRLSWNDTRGQYFFQVFAPVPGCFLLIGSSVKYVI
jgi:hypothetical protein